MKQLKAIEILKAIEEQEDTHLWLDDGSGYPKKYIIEAIDELEELKNRSCDNCKHFKTSFKMEMKINHLDDDKRLEFEEEIRKLINKFEE